MGNIIDYVKEWGQYSLLDRPFNEVDSLVLCQLVYLHYEKFVPGLEERNSPVTIKSIFEHPEKEHILDDYWYREDNMELFTAAVHSVRFGNLKMNYYVNIINEGEETQFSAMTFILEDKNVYMAYRGTDATIIGWKEDFNLAFSKPLHSQQLAAEYMDRVAGYIGGSFFAGGHSKGGNLVVYAAMNCQPKTRSKLLQVYNHDGPGFRPEIREAGNYAAIADRVHKYIPRSSIVGMLLEDHCDYEVIESKGVGLLQHNAYSWKIDENAFIRAKGMTDGRKIRDGALNEWVLSLTEEEGHAFVDTLYDIISASEAYDVFEFGADWKKSMTNIFEAAKGVDDTTKKVLQKIFKSLFEITGERAVIGFQEKTKEFQKEVKALTNKRKNAKAEKIEKQKEEKK